MYSYPHIKIMKPYLLLNLINNIKQRESKINNIFGLLCVIPLNCIYNPHCNIAIANCIQFIDIKMQAHFIKFFEEISEESDYLFRGDTGGVFGKAGDIGIEDRSIFKDFS